MASPFVGTPAGTPVPPTTSARYYTRNQVFSRVPITGTNFTSGKQASFVTEATGGRHLVLNESRLVVKFKARMSAARLVLSPSGGEVLARRCADAAVAAAAAAAAAAVAAVAVVAATKSEKTEVRRPQ